MAFSRKQLAILAFPTTKYSALVCDGAIRSGKTSVMSLSFVLWAMSEFDRQNFAICGKSVESAVRNIILPLIGVSYLPQHGFRLKYNTSKHCLTISRGRRVNYFYIYGGKDESSYMLIQGITLAGVMLDEVALMPRSFVEQATGRCSVTGSRFWFNCNPEGPQHWFYEEWVKDEKQEKNRLHLHFLLDDNPSLDPEIKARYERMYSGVFRERYILGRWTKAEGLVYPMFDREKHVVDTLPERSSRHRYYVSVDYGVSNPFAAGLYDYDPIQGRAVKIKELYYKGGSTNRVDNEAYYKMLREFIGDYSIEYLIIDPSASSMIETIQKYGEYMVVPADNDVLNGIQDVTKFMNTGSLLFYKDCVETFKEFGEYSWDEKKQKDTVIKENDHAMDEVRYFCRTALRHELQWIV
ncbi:PBSX family phage terminase large subunit [Acutalibacter sp. 1XD8-36]|uniref:PBSX family phage terminase large subunit n=1 Tax=Acutalibacter sp. 1XD8-36 TaxID=2320852 RepID=UPI002610522A|nr:PBSX family phage terminase large subunit [Acutalibacter sp. 1XD8-36]